MKKAFIELHVIQPIAGAVCLNRDNNGVPKSAIFGDTKRTRVSSQSWYYAMRENLKRDEFFGALCGVRTKKSWVYELAQALMNLGYAKEEAKHMAEFVMCGLGNLPFLEANSKGNPDKEESTSSLELRDQKTIDALRDVAIAFACDLEAPTKAWNKERKDQKTLKKNPASAKLEAEVFESIPELKIAIEALRSAWTIDTAIKGAMYANSKRMETIFSSMKIAHALSVNRTSIQSDYFIGTDDLQALGAGHLGNADFTCPVLYRYVAIEWHTLVKNCNGDEVLARRALDWIVTQFIYAFPGGKSATMAGMAQPKAVLARVTDGGPMNSLMNAFEQHVVPEGDDGISTVAVRKMLQHYADKKELNGVVPLHESIAVEKSCASAVKSFKITQRNFRELTDGILEVVSGE